jgi:hypothetical protein
VRLLLLHGARCDTEDGEALIAASRYGHEAVVRLLHQSLYASSCSLRQCVAVTKLAVDAATQAGHGHIATELRRMQEAVSAGVASIGGRQGMSHRPQARSRLCLPAVRAQVRRGCHQTIPPGLGSNMSVWLVASDASTLDMH